MKTTYIGLEELYATYPDFYINFIIFLESMDTMSRVMLLFGIVVLIVTIPPFIMTLCQAYKNDKILTN